MSLMSNREMLGVDVFSAAVERMVKLYEDGHRIIVSFSGGKDSTCCYEICRMTALQNEPAKNLLALCRAAMPESPAKT